MTSLAPSWQVVGSRAGARFLQSFTCTSELPRSESGRTLRHPRPWEWEVQAHLRELSKRLAPGELLLVGTDSSDEPVAAAHLIQTLASDYVETLVAAGAVHVDVRGSGGAVADALMAECARLAVAAARENRLAAAIVTGRIHLMNGPSQLMATRAGMSPVDAPVGTYQTWARWIGVGQQ